jgi:hypothetical protein
VQQREQSLPPSPLLLQLQPQNLCPVLLPAHVQAALVKEQPLVYNKESMLNPFFVVFGRRQEGGAAKKA